ncbi:hypothetical protein WKT22_04626 [Candidatus Lokiarchaeum ossiferum]
MKWEFNSILTTSLMDEWICFDIGLFGASENQKQYPIIGMQGISLK